MIDITKAVAKQTTGAGGVLTPWVVSLDGQVLYVLPRETTIEDTFNIRDDIEKLIKQAYQEGVEKTEQAAAEKLNNIVSQGEAKLALLKLENERLALALERHIISEDN